MYSIVIIIHFSTGLDSKLPALTQVVLVAEMSTSVATIRHQRVKAVGMRHMLCINPSNILPLSQNGMLLRVLGLKRVLTSTVCHTVWLLGLGKTRKHDALHGRIAICSSSSKITALTLTAVGLFLSCLESPKVDKLNPYNPFPLSLAHLYIRYILM